MIFYSVETIKCVIDIVRQPTLLGRCFPYLTDNDPCKDHFFSLGGVDGFYCFSASSWEEK